MVWIESVTSSQSHIFGLQLKTTYGECYQDFGSGYPVMIRKTLAKHDKIITIILMSHTHTYHVDWFSLPLISGWNATNMNGTPENQMAKWFVAAGLYGGTAYSFVQIAAGECL